MSENDFPQNDGMPADDAEHLTESGAENESEPAENVIAGLNDRILRLAAELENTRRRAVREKTDAGRYAIANFARDLLGVADNFERALAAAPSESSGSGDETLSGLIEGVQMTEKELLSVFERHGIQRISPAGEKFDPNKHQAVAQIPDASVPSGHVVDVAQPGFMIGERVLRAAIVTVSSGNAGVGNDEPTADPTA